MSAESAAERWRWYREHTPAAQNSVYLNSGWVGPSTERVVAAMQAYLRDELEAGPTRRDLFERRVAMRERYRELAATVLGARPESVTITSNTTDGLNVVLGGLPLAEGDRVVSTNIEHPSGVVPTYWTRERSATEVEFVPLGGNDTPGQVVEKLAAGINRRTRLVVLSHISFATGQVLPLRELCEVAHGAGALVLVDGAQTAGHIPIDVGKLDADFYAIPMHKWLCGPSGLGALYIRPELIAPVQPQRTSGRGAESWDFEGGFVPAHDDIKKFETGTLSTVLVAGANEAMEQYLESGPEAVFDRVRDLNRYAEDRFGRIAAVSQVSPGLDDTRSGLFAFSVDGFEAAKVAPHIQRANHVVCRSVASQNAVRLSLHVFNDESDIEAAAEAIEQVVREGMPEEGDTGPAD